MSRPSLRRAAPAALALTCVLGIAACTDKAETSAGSTAAGAGGPIVVNATDTTCDLSATTAKAGTVTFEVTNAGSKVNEFYVYAEGDRIVAEVENITPGLKRELKVEITEPGTFTTACKPGMVGDGIRAPFTVTGTAVAGSADQKVAKAIADYKAFVASESDEFVEGTEQFVAAVKAGDVAKAKSLYAQARHPWEAIEPVAESFGDLDPKIDGREDVIAEGMAFTGYHRLEKDLWVTGLQKDSSAIADQLLADVRRSRPRARPSTRPRSRSRTAPRRCSTRSRPARSRVRRSATRTPTSGTSTATSRARARQLAALRPVITERDPALQKALDARFTELSSLLGSHKTGADYKSYTALTDADIKALTVSLDALSEEVSKVPGVVEAK